MNESNPSTHGSEDIALLSQSAVHDPINCLACQKIKDEDIYLLSPLARLLNREHYVTLFMQSGPISTRVHKTLAITLALFNGRRTVADIARITRPFVNERDDRKATEIAKHKVKSIIYNVRRSKMELSAPPYFTPGSVLLMKDAYDIYFARTEYPHVEYYARDFLPKDGSKINEAAIPVEHEPVPVVLKWHFTSKCATNCRYCGLKRRKVKILPKERILSLIKEAAAIGVPYIEPAGGDVLLYPYLKDVLTLMHECKFAPVNISTKAFISEEKAKMLVDTRLVKSLQFSIDSTDNEVADYLVRGKNYCQRTFASIDNALKAGLRINTRTVITAYNLFTIPKLYRDLKKRGVNKIIISMYVRSAFHHSDDLFIHKDGYAWLEDQIQELKKEFPKDDFSIQNGKPRPKPSSIENREKEGQGWKMRPQCSAARYRMMICTDGKVIPCEQMLETEEYFCGDLNCQSILEVWNGERLREMTYGMPRERFKGRPCYDCEDREICHNYKGICVRNLSQFHGNIYQPDASCPKSDLPFVRLG